MDTLIYILDGALDGARDLQSVNLTNMVYYSLSTYDTLRSLDSVNCDFHSMSFAWYYACESAIRANQAYGKDLIVPDIQLTFAAMARADELTESYTSDRPDGSGWDTLLNAYSIDWYTGWQRGSYSEIDDDMLLQSIEDMLLEFDDDPYDDDGNPFTQVGFGIAMDDTSYYFLWFYIN